jgi:hypothetical protein
MRKAREIVVRTEESEAEPGEGWWKEPSFWKSARARSPCSE